MPEKKKIEPVVTGEVTVSKKKKFKDSFIQKDLKTVKDYTIFDVLLPSIRNVLYDIFVKGLGMLMYGDSNRAGTSSGTLKPYQQVSFKPYDQAYRPAQQQSQPRQSNNVFDYNKFVLADRGDAEAVLRQMADIIEEYGTVSVSDLYELLRQDAPYTSENYGWKNISTAKVGVCSDGFTLILPPIMPLK